MHLTRKEEKKRKEGDMAVIQETETWDPATANTSHASARRDSTHTHTHTQNKMNDELCTINELSHFFPPPFSFFFIVSFFFFIFSFSLL
jgi:hypothetical protein